MKILVTPTSFSLKNVPDAWKFLESFAAEIVVNPTGKPLTEDEIIPLLEGVDGWIAGLDYITEKVIQQAPAGLKAISRYGVGIERVNLTAASNRGILVANTPGTNSESVADLVFGLMLAVARRIPFLNEQVKNGGWPRFSGTELYKKTIGILGLGAIGKAVAKRAAGFSMKIAAYDPWMDNEYAVKNGIIPMTLDELITCSDILSLHLPLNGQTQNILNAERISQLRPGVIIVNTARGGLMDEEALLAGLKSGRIGGLGLDAFVVEPPVGNSLFQFDNVVATPHSGAHTTEATLNMAMMSVENLRCMLLGIPCMNVVNNECEKDKK